MKNKIELFKHVAFVAIKNAIHNQRGYIYSNDKFFTNSIINVKDLYSILISYFGKNE